MSTLYLTDSNFQSDSNDKIKGFKESGAFMEVVDELNRQFVAGEIQIVHLQNYNHKITPESPIWYEVKSYKPSNSKIIVDECKFSTSHYIGRFSRNGLDIIINPRFGNKIFQHIISYATNLFLPIGSSDIKEKTTSNSFWLIALLWKAMLNKALASNQIPKEYQTITRNQKNFRGRLMVSKHIKANLCNASMFYCTYKKLSMDNIINRTIRATYNILEKKSLNALVGEFSEYDNRLSSLGVASELDNINQIDTIRYTKMNYAYFPVMQLSKAILSNKNAESYSEGKRADVSYFIDIAELWEMYLLRLLQRELPEEYRVYSPNAQNGEYLLEKNAREIRPDIIIEKDNRIVMIIDAKYKWYKNFGSTAKLGVSREDLYQMVTYLYHYGQEGMPIAGIFTSPAPMDIKHDVYSFNNNPNHQIGLLNLNVEKCGENIEILHEEEEEYILEVKKILEKSCKREESYR